MVATKKIDKAPTGFEEALHELETLIGDMERGELPLEASLHAYQRGAFLVRFCQSKLQAVQEQVQLVEAGMARPLDEAEVTGAG